MEKEGETLVATLASCKRNATSPQSKEERRERGKDSSLYAAWYARGRFRGKKRGKTATLERRPLLFVPPGRRLVICSAKEEKKKKKSYPNLTIAPANNSGHKERGREMHVSAVVAGRRFG